MNRLLPATAAGLVLAVWLAGTPVHAQQTPKPQEELQQLILDLTQLKALVGSVTDKVLRDRMEKVVLDMEQRAAALQKALAAPATETVKKAIADADFQKLLAGIKKESFDDNKLPLVKDAVKYHYFTCAQVATLVKTMTFSDGQVQTAVTLYPRVMDPANFQLDVLPAFTFESDKDKVRKALGLK